MSNDLASSTLFFIFDNIFAIFFVVVLFSLVTVFIIVHDISFKEKPIKLSKVITIEKFSTNNLKQESLQEMRNNNSCDKLKFKDACIAGGSCVWVTSKVNNNLIKKCVTSNPNIDTTAAGSDGPEKKCFKHNNKLIPWEEYYYLDGKDTKMKKLNLNSC